MAEHGTDLSALWLVKGFFPNSQTYTGEDEEIKLRWRRKEEIR